MIALNEIIKNREIFEYKYKLKGQKVALDKLFHFAADMKKLQLKTEALRADCNKLCGMLAIEKNKKANILPLLKDIKALDKQINQNNKRLESINKKINIILKKLDNLPLDENQENILIKTGGTRCLKNEFDEFVNQILPTKKTNLNILNQLISLKNINSSAEFEIYHCKDGYLILTTQENAHLTKETILNFLKLKSKSITKASIKDLSKQSAQTYIVQLNNQDTLYIEFIGEYLTREYKIKYHDKSSDMTKFINQINIYIK